jgi:hypothetical protein
MPSTRVLAVAALAACAALAAPAGAAAPKPQITDPTGDSTVLGAGGDIVSALFSTAGTTAKVGKKTVYTPTKLLITITYAADVASEPYASHAVRFEVPGCGEVYLQHYSGGTFGSAPDSCVTDAFDPNTSVKGKTLTFTLPFSTIGKAYMKKGAALTDLKVYTAVADPVLGYESGELGGDQGSSDVATTTAVYRIS